VNAKASAKLRKQAGPLGGPTGKSLLLERATCKTGVGVASRSASKDPRFVSGYLGLRCVRSR
jgi:hypothetical protein